MSDASLVHVACCEWQLHGQLPCRASTPPLVQQLVTLCTSFLSSPASSRIMAGQLLARLLTRPDTVPALQDFLTWCVPALEPQGPQDVFRIPGMQPPTRPFDGY